MNKSSALIIAVAIIVGCVILGMLLREPPHDVKMQAQHLSIQGGRYHLVPYKQDLLMLDSHTGRYWIKGSSMRIESGAWSNWTEKSHPNFAKTSEQK